MEGHVKTELLHIEFCSSSVLRDIIFCDKFLVLKQSSS